MRCLSGDCYFNVVQLFKCFIYYQYGRHYLRKSPFVNCQIKIFLCALVAYVSCIRDLRFPFVFWVIQNAKFAMPEIGCICVALYLISIA